MVTIAPRFLSPRRLAFQASRMLSTHGCVQVGRTTPRASVQHGGGGQTRLDLARRGSEGADTTSAHPFAVAAVATAAAAVTAALFASTSPASSAPPTSPASPAASTASTSATQSERQSERLLDTPLLGQLPLPFASWLRDPAYRDATNGAPMAEVRKRPGVPAVAGEPLFTTDEVRRKGSGGMYSWRYVPHLFLGG